MLKAILREQMGGQERDRRTVVLDRSLGSITLGRGDGCTYQIGRHLGEWAKGIGRIQATIEFADGAITLIDGARDRPSTNGVWVGSEPIEGSIALVPGLELTLFKHGLARVSLVISDDQALLEPGRDTYTGDDLQSVLQAQVGLLQEQIQRIEEQVQLMAAQLIRREEIDAHQTTVIDQLQRRVRRIIGGLLAVAALVVLGSGLAKDLAPEERKEWGALVRSLIKEVVIAGALGTGAVYIQKEKGEKPTA